jgi:hypothetical protein
VRALLDLLAASQPVDPASGDGRDWLALGVAAYGAIVATSVAVYQFARDRPGVKVKLAAVTSAEVGSGRLIERWAVRVVNHRQRPITIDSAGVLVNEGQVLQAPFVDFNGDAVDHPFPATLTDGQDIRVFVRVIDGGGADVTGAWARDSLGRSYKTSRSPRARWRTWRLNRRLKRAFKRRAKPKRG